MKVFMQAQGVWNAVEPSDPKAPIEEKMDKVAMTMIYQGIPEEMLLSLAEKKTSKDVWETIKALFQGAEKVKQARLQTLKSEFEALSMKENEQIDGFYKKMNALVTNIQALGEDLGEAYVVKKLLRAIPPKFVQITSTMEQFGNLDMISVEEAIGSLKAHEERLKGKTEMNESQLMLTEEEWAKREGNEGKLLLTREEWLKRTNIGSYSSAKSRGVRDKSKIKCYSCNIYGHFAAECGKPKRIRETKQEADMAMVEDDEPALLMAKCEREELKLVLNESKTVVSLLIKNEDKASKSNVWYLDNGASNHMTGF